MDLGKAIAREALGSESKVEFKQAKSADRVPFLNSGEVDLVLSTMTANERSGRNRSTSRAPTTSPVRRSW